MEKNNLLTYVFIASAMFVVGPITYFFTLYMTSLDYALIFVGVIGVADALFDMVGRFAAGVLSDRKGRRRPLLFLTVGLITYPFLLIYFDSLPALLFISVLLAVVSASFWTVVIAYLYDTNPKEKRGRVYSHALMANFVVNLLGPLVAGLIIDAHGYHWLFAIASYVGVIPLVTLFFLKKPVNKRQELTIKGEVSDIVNKPRFIKIWVSMMILSMSASFVSRFFPIFLREDMHLSYTTIGLFFSGGTVILLLAQPFIGWLADRFKSRIIIPLGLGVAAISQLGMAVAASVLGLFFARGLFPVGVFTSRVKGASVVAKMTPNEEHALAHALFKSSSGVGWTVMNAVAPILIVAIGYAGVFQALALLSALTGVGYLATYTRGERSEKKGLWAHVKDHHAFHFTDSNLFEHYRHK